MRRLRDRQSGSGLFRGGELARLMTMIVMLGVLGMMMRKARDADTWRFFTGEPPQASQTHEEEAESRSAEAQPPVETSSTAQGSETSTAGNVSTEPSLDQDSLEREELDREYEAVTDRAPITLPEMFAYWRLLKWDLSENVEVLRSRAKADVRFNDLLERPEEYRGRLIRVKLHIERVRKESNQPENPLGLTTLYESVGWNDASQAWFYICVSPDLPPGMAVGDRVKEEGTFVGYFFKNMSYLDGSGRKIWAPVLIGRWIWHPTPTVKLHSDTEWMWPWLAAGLLGVLFVLRWGWRFMPGRGKKQAALGPSLSDPDHSESDALVERWLSDAEAPGQTHEIICQDVDEWNGSAENPEALPPGFTDDSPKFPPPDGSRRKTGFKTP